MRDMAIWMGPMLAVKNGILGLWKRNFQIFLVSGSARGGRIRKPIQESFKTVTHVELQLYLPLIF